MSDVASVALFAAFMVNAFGAAQYVDRQQMQVGQIEIRYRGDPGPAEVERTAPAHADPPVQAAIDRSPSPATSLQTFRQLDAARSTASDGAYPRSPDCRADNPWRAGIPPVTLASAHVLEKWHHGQPCH